HEARHQRRRPAGGTLARGDVRCGTAVRSAESHVGGAPGATFEISRSAARRGPGICPGTSYGERTRSSEADARLVGDPRANDARHRLGRADASADRGARPREVNGGATSCCTGSMLFSLLRAPLYYGAVRMQTPAQEERRGEAMLRGAGDDLR